MKEFVCRFYIDSFSTNKASSTNKQLTNGNEVKFSHKGKGSSSNEGKISLKLEAK